MIANHPYRPRVLKSPARSPFMRNLKVALRGERFTLAIAGFGLATAAWAAAIALHPAFMPLAVLPVLLAARYRDRRLAAVAIASTVLAVAAFSRFASLEREVWYGFLFGLASAGLYLLGERALVPAKKGDKVAHFLKSGWRGKREMNEVTMECDGLDQIASMYGEGARRHASQILARTIEQETTGACFVSRTGDSMFTIVFPGEEEKSAVTAISRIRSRFAQAVRDAGYDCSVSLGELPTYGSASPYLFVN